LGAQYRFTDTPIVEAPARLLLAGLPFANIRDVVQAMIYVSHSDLSRCDAQFFIEPITWQASTSDKVAGAALSVDPKGVLLIPHYSSDLDSSDKGFLHIFSGRAIFLIRFVLQVDK